MWTYEQEHQGTETEVQEEGGAALEIVYGADYEEVRLVLELKQIGLTDQHRRVTPGEILANAPAGYIGWLVHERNDQ